MNPAVSNPSLIEGVLTKRALALLVDVCVIVVLWTFFAILLGVFGLLTLGLGWGLFAVLPVVPFLYHFLTLAKYGATPGQRFMGLAVRRFEDLGPPTPLEAFVCTLCFYATMAVSGGILLLAALVTDGKRTLHDIVSGLIVVRADAAPYDPTGISGGAYRG